MIVLTVAELLLLIFSGATQAQSVSSPYSASIPANLSLLSSSGTPAQVPPQGGPLRAPWRLLLGYEGGSYFIYPYAILKIPIWGSLENGWTLKLAGDGLMYEFNAGPAGKIQATAPAAEALLGYSLTRETGSLSLLVGPQYRHTYCSHGFTSAHHYDDVGFKSELTAAGHWGDLLQVDDIIHSTVTGSYTTVNDFYRIQGRPLLFGARTGLQFGPEATLLGNPDFRRQQYGVVVTNIPLGHNITLTPMEATSATSP